MKVTPNPNIELIDPLRRKCFFDDEHPSNNPLVAYKKYSQVKWITWLLEKIFDLSFDAGCLYIGMQDEDSARQHDGQGQVPSVVLSPCDIGH